jgi:hypothetical protein
VSLRRDGGGAAAPQDLRISREDRVDSSGKRPGRVVVGDDVAKIK